MNSQSLLEGLLLGVPNAQSLVEIKVGKGPSSFELDQQAKLIGKARNRGAVLSISPEQETFSLPICRKPHEVGMIVP